MNHVIFDFFLGYVLPVQQTVPVATISPHSMQQFPFLRRDLLVSHGRINYNSSFAYSPNADDLPCKYHFMYTFHVIITTRIAFALFFF